MMRLRRLAVLLAILSLTACAGPGEQAARADRPAFELQVLHSSDNESGFVDPITLEPKILHYAALASGLANTHSDTDPRAPRARRRRKASIAFSRNARLDVLPPQLSTA